MEYYIPTMQYNNRVEIVKSHNMKKEDLPIIQHSLSNLSQPISNNQDLSNERNHSPPFSIHLQSPGKQQYARESEEQNLPNDDHSESDFYCMTCHQNYNIKISPCAHKKSIKQKYSCDYNECQKSFNIESGLQRHKLTHTGLKPYECDYDSCEQRFNQKSNLNRHKRIHTQEKPFICDKCCKSFTTTTNLKQHVQVHFEDKERRKKYVCQIKGCNKQYLYMCNLKKHKQEHEDPLGDCLLQKKPDFPLFSVNIGSCNFRIAYKKNKEHSEILITFNQVENGLIYSLDSFQKVLDEINREQKPDQEPENTIKTYIEDLQSILREFLQLSKNALNITFQMHEGLSSIANLFAKALINLVQQSSNLKVFTLIMPSYNVFRDVIQNLLIELQPRQS